MDKQANSVFKTKIIPPASELALVLHLFFCQLSAVNPLQAFKLGL